MSTITILENKDIEQKTLRIAYQIYETLGDDEDLILAGISKNGFIFAQKIGKSLEEISETRVTLCEVFIDKTNPLNPITTSISKENYTNKNIILVDDVLNTGTTLIYGVKHFLEVPTKKIKTAVLVDRNHKKYPVKADFKGVSLSTSIKEHVHIDFSKGEAVAYLL